MKKFTLLFSALLLAIASFAAKTTAVVTAGQEACYIAGEEVLTVTGLSAQELGYNGTLVLQVYGWDGGGLSGGYAAILSNQGDEVASCDEELMVVKSRLKSLNLVKGDVSAVRAAVETGAAEAAPFGKIHGEAVIASPHGEIMKYFDYQD